MKCKCIKFANDLFKILLCTDLSELQLLWKLEDFVKQYPRHVYEVNKLCIIMLDKLKNSDKVNLKRLFIEICNLICLCFVTEERTSHGCLLVFYKHFENVSSLSRHYYLHQYTYPFLYNISNERILTALTGKSKYMKLLVNLDIFSYLSSSYASGRQIRLVLYDLMRDIDGTRPTIETFNKCSKMLNMARYLFFPGDDIRSLKRIHWTVIAIKATFFNRKQEENIAKELICCLKMCFPVTGEPLLTINEVKSMLYVILFVHEKLNLFEPLYEEFLKIMPDCPDKFEPRNLTDLARWEIRKNIRKCNLHFPAEIVQLNLPQPLREFVLGNVIRMSRMSRNVSPEQIFTKSQLEELVSESARIISSYYNY